MNGPYAENFQPLWDSGIRRIVPLPPGRKSPPPRGYTGTHGIRPSYADLMAWAEDQPNANIAIVMEPGQVAVDVDAYVKHGKAKIGDQTIAELEARTGVKLPPTWKISSRGEGISGKYLYRLPDPEIVLCGSLPDVEIIQSHHRYVVAPLSINSDDGGRTVLLYGPDGKLTVRFPPSEEWPLLPDEIVAELRVERHAGRLLTLEEASSFYATLPEGPYCATIGNHLERAKAACRGTSRHDTVLKAVLTLIRMGEQGHPGAPEALTELQAEFVEALGDARHGEQIAEAEFRRMVHGPQGIAQILDSPTREGDRGCRCAEYRTTEEIEEAVRSLLDGTPDLVEAVAAQYPEKFLAIAERAGATGYADIARQTLERRAARRRGEDTRPITTVDPQTVMDEQEDDELEDDEPPGGLGLSPAAFAPEPPANDGGDPPESVDPHEPPAAPAPRRRATINAVGRDFHDLYVEIENGLTQSERDGGEPSLFVHGSDLVIAGRGELQVLDQSLLTKQLADRLEFIKYVRVGRGADAQMVERPADPPNKVVAALHSGRKLLKLPEVDRVAHSPFFGPDGILQRTPGYHPAARVLYVPEPGLIVPDISPDPTPAEVSWALKLLVVELLGDFPFATPADLAGALAAGLTPYVQPRIDGPGPLMAFDAPESRSGKGLLAEALFAPACGRSWTVTPAPTKVEEWHKSIVSALRSGPLVAMFDNVNNKIASGALASAVTAWPILTSRILGFSQNVRMPPPAVWACLGNNLRGTTEIVERQIPIRIDSGEEKPGRRKAQNFRHPNLRRWFTDNRGQIVAAWLTIAQAWFAAGQPIADTPAMGGFEQWVEVIGSILAFHGIHDLLGNREEYTDAMDDDRESWGAFMAYLAASGALEWTVPQLVEMALDENGPGCPVDLDHGADRSQVTKMGTALAELRGQRFGGYVLRKRRSNVARTWYLDPVEKPAE